MKLIINTVNIKIGGVLEDDISFLNELKNIGHDGFGLFYNVDLDREINTDVFPKNFKFYLFENSPARLRYRKKVISRFNALEKDLVSTNVVFSFVGPSYWRTKSPHLVGFAVPHIVYDDYNYVKTYSWKSNS